MTTKHKKFIAAARDYFATPRGAIDPVLKYIPAGVKRIWEPTTGGGAIASVLEEAGYEVVRTDLHPQGQDTRKLDFLKDDPEECDLIMLNPPFSQKVVFLRRLIELGKPFVCLMPLTVLEGRRQAMLRGRVSVVLLDKRVEFMEGKKCAFASVWLLGGIGEADRIHYERM